MISTVLAINLQTAFQQEMATNFFTLKRLGSGNIRLFSFRFANGKPFESFRHYSEPQQLSAELAQGKKFIDFPGTFSPIPLVVSCRVHELLSGFAVHPSIQWHQVRIDSNILDQDKSQFWACSIVVEALPSVLNQEFADRNPREYIFGDNPAVVEDIDLLIDESMHELFSLRLRDALLELELPHVSFDLVGERQCDTST
ncbi:hypothetical protein [Roseiconus lacunae]|uniref:Uncharacterized protein n=1 Tax=Roseiconus lacunae TaxID=2605694 RepID=A0ABT7PSP0_9BACT|nr:hypothetical protein [Roseiconus lacunae]MDM4019475.1 hypothetical protein [Roseiconus lacunae]